MTTLMRTEGSTQAASYIQEKIEEVHARFIQSETLGKRQALLELEEVCRDCSLPDWDGYEALPVSVKTFQHAKNVLESLPLNCPVPSFGAEADGHITLEWYRHPRWILSISVSPEGYLHYAALFGEDSTNGSEFFRGEVSSHILNLIEQVSIQTI